MRVGVILPLADGETPDGHAPTFAETLAFARHAEAAGLDSIWTVDHVLFRFPGEPEHGIREGWTTLAALGAFVPRVELGALVMCSSFRNPALMAKMAGALDDLSGGRLILGLGAGWHDPEYEAFGYPIDHKVGRFAEDVEITTRLLRGERVTFEGRWQRTVDAVLLPPPARPVPVLVGAKGPRMLGLTATWADAWNTAWFGRVDDRLRTRMAGLDAACAAIGRDPATIRRTIGVRLHEPGTGTDDAFGLDADAAGLADLLDELAALGVDDALVWSIAKSLPALDRIAEARSVHLARAR
ncbi:MAG TPA: LLM class flavin-dependent oxidoreductase [Candidatus Limnocylindrales bacterium]|nr:LLM class flavin-dependent oxidoreductase [Candidatus Limnocylindrales bacterium]